MLHRPLYGNNKYRIRIKCQIKFRKKKTQILSKKRQLERSMKNYSIRTMVYILNKNIENGM